jgi:hypothetical protein
MLHLMNNSITANKFELEQKLAQKADV